MVRLERWPHGKRLYAQGESRKIGDRSGEEVEKMNKRIFEARPAKSRPDYKTLSKFILKRFPKTFAYLAKGTDMEPDKMSKHQQRLKLANAMLKSYYKKYDEIGTQRESMLAALDAIGAAGFCVVDPGAASNAPAGWDFFRATAIAHNLANASETMEKGR